MAEINLQTAAGMLRQYALEVQQRGAYKQADHIRNIADRILRG